MSLVIDAETGVRDMVFTSVHALLEISITNSRTTIGQNLPTWTAPPDERITEFMLVYRSKKRTLFTSTMTLFHNTHESLRMPLFLH
jgi:hypothetical protein